MKTTFLFLINLIIFDSIQASLHISDHNDQDFINLGNHYKSVGCFMASDLALASGVLINTGIPSLNGKIVLTSAHYFEEDNMKVENVKFFFSDDTTQASQGYFIPHPHYSSDAYGYDIGIFILNEKIENIPLSQPYWKNYDFNWANQYYVNVGYGVTGHIFGGYKLFDTKRRGSFAFAPWKYNANINFEEENLHLKNVPYVINQKSFLNLYPDNNGYYFNINTVKTYLNPLGMAYGGDSGGGCFNAQDKLVGIISLGTKNRKSFPKKEKNISHTYLAMHNSLFRDKRDVLLQYGIPEKMIISSPQLNHRALVKPPFYEKYIINNKFHISTTVTLIAPYREWILHTLLSLSMHNSKKDIA